MSIEATMARTKILAGPEEVVSLWVEETFKQFQAILSPEEHIVSINPTSQWIDDAEEGQGVYYVSLVVGISQNPPTANELIDWGRRSHKMGFRVGK